MTTFWFQYFPLPSTHQWWMIRPNSFWRYKNHKKELHYLWPLSKANWQDWQQHCLWCGHMCTELAVTHRWVRQRGPCVSVVSCMVTHAKHFEVQLWATAPHGLFRARDASNIITVMFLEYWCPQVRGWGLLILANQEKMGFRFNWGSVEQAAWEMDLLKKAIHFLNIL